MTKATRKKWKRANRFKRLAWGEIGGTGRHPAALKWARRHERDYRCSTTASLALDGLSIGDLK